jgi:hypothetical protein
MYVTVMNKQKNATLRLLFFGFPKSFLIVKRISPHTPFSQYFNRGVTQDHSPDSPTQL